MHNSRIRRQHPDKGARMRNGQVQGHPMILLWSVVCSFSVLAGSVLCSVLPVEAKSDYEIINTGIKGGGCWYDDSHFIVVKGHQPAPGQEFEVEGLYYLDPNQPKDLKRIDLAPLEPSLQRHVRDVTCQDQSILFHILTADKKRNSIYSMKIGQAPTVLVEKTEGFVLPQAVSVRNQFVLGFAKTIPGGEAEHSSSAEAAVKDCHFTNLLNGYRVFCLRHDRGTKRTWLVNNGYVAQYIWDETIRVNEDGHYKWVPNPDPPLKLSDGTELKQGYLLRDFGSQVLQEISIRQGVYRIDAISFKLNPSGNYLYARCSREGDYNPRKTFFGRICRFPTAGATKQWEEVFTVQKEPNERASLYDLDVNDAGDVVVLHHAYRSSPVLWKYSEGDRSVVELRIPRLDQGVGAVRLAPNSRTISYVEKGYLTFVRMRGGKQ